MSSPWDAPAETTSKPVGDATLTSNTTLARVVVAAMAIQWVANVVTSSSGAIAFLADEDSPTQVIAILVMGLSALCMLVVYAVSMVSWMVWQNRAATNLIAMGREGLQYTPAAHVYWWFVPFANLVAPFRTLRELHLASDASDPHWQAGAEPPWLRLMWGTWIAGSIVSNLATRMEFRLGTSGASIGLDLTSLALHSVACLTFAWLVLEIDARQEAALRGG